MNDVKLSKEEQKAIKRGFAYKTWSRKRGLVILGFFAWGIGGIGLIHINSVTSAIYTIGLIIGLIMMFYSIVVACWKCPVCKNKLPAKDVLSSTASVRMPVLVKNCPCCGEDLTNTRVSK